MVWWYHHGRSADIPGTRSGPLARHGVERDDRDTALDATVARWAADVSNGEQATMYAWKRANVAELNRRGRAAWEEMGRLSGPELVVGDSSCRAGDCIVALAPAPMARW